MAKLFGATSEHLGRGTAHAEKPNDLPRKDKASASPPEVDELSVLKTMIAELTRRVTALEHERHFDQDAQRLVEKSRNRLAGRSQNVSGGFS